jgi:hypothetical protein
MSKVTKYKMISIKGDQKEITDLEKHLKLGYVIKDLEKHCKTETRLGL